MTTTTSRRSGRHQFMLLVRARCCPLSDGFLVKSAFDWVLPFSKAQSKNTNIKAEYHKVILISFLDHSEKNGDSSVCVMNRPRPSGWWSLNDMQNSWQELTILHIGWITQWRRCGLSSVHLHVILIMELTHSWEKQNVRLDPTFKGLKVWKHLKRGQGLRWA